MAFVTFVTPYTPIICGIADYCRFITREIPRGSWDVLSFNLENYGVPLSDDLSPLTEPIWYGIASRDNYSAGTILSGLERHRGQVLWFQHEFGIWRGDARFATMLRTLKALGERLVVTLHSLHFQSNETPYGLRRKEFALLRSILPHVDAITVFSEGVQRAVNQAFPEYSYKVHIIRHGAHLYPHAASMSKQEAKHKIHSYFIGEPSVYTAIKKALTYEEPLLDRENFLIGGAGFVTASKGIEHIFRILDMLQQLLPGRRLAAIYAGFLREPDSKVDGTFAANMRSSFRGSGRYFIETFLPPEVLPVMLRALDVHFYWPSDCTQSGLLAHSLGSGALLACRDLEGVGETVKLAGGLVTRDLDSLALSLQDLILAPELRNKMSVQAYQYAERFSWARQASAHMQLVESVCGLPTMHTDKRSRVGSGKELTLHESSLNHHKRPARRKHVMPLG